MQQDMDNLKLLNKIAACVSSALIFISCTTREPMLEITLRKQTADTPFTFAELYKEQCDSIYFIYPYDNEGTIRALPYKMSESLRSECSYTLDDSHVKILFIDKGTVKAYTKIGRKDAYFPSSDDNHAPILPVGQQFIIDKNRVIHIYNK